VFIQVKDEASEQFIILLCTEQLTKGSRVLLEKLTVDQLAKKFLAFYGTPCLITVFTTARHWYLRE
jgi:hypothetical protein